MELLDISSFTMRGQELIIIKLDLEHPLDDEVLFVKETKEPLKEGDKYRTSQKFNESIANEILGLDWLSDETINLAQLLLHQAFPTLNGFEETTLGNNDKLLVIAMSICKYVHSQFIFTQTINSRKNKSVLLIF